MQILNDHINHTITIKRRDPLGENSFYDLASLERDRVIRMGEIFQYAVIPPDYTKARITRHIQFKDALRRYRQLIKRGFAGVAVFDRMGAYVHDPALYRAFVGKRVAV